MNYFFTKNMKVTLEKAKYLFNEQSVITSRSSKCLDLFFYVLWVSTNEASDSDGSHACISLLPLPHSPLRPAAAHAQCRELGKVDGKDFLISSISIHFEYHNGGMVTMHSLFGFMPLFGFKDSSIIF